MDEVLVHNSGELGDCSVLTSNSFLPVVLKCLFHVRIIHICQVLSSVHTWPDLSSIPFS